MTIADHLAAARRRFEDAAIPPSEAALDADLLARHVLGWDRAALVTRRREEPPPGFQAPFEALVARRANREPAAYILGEREFWGLPFEVTRDVLIPRPETELIVEEALVAFGGGTPPATVIDVCTGSGCLAVTLAREFGGAEFIATDISEAALDVARRNAQRHHVAPRIAFRAADLFDGISARADLIVSNPPYVRDGDRANIQPEVRFEPSGALYAGVDGLDVIRRLVPQSVERLTRGGTLMFEFGFGQADAVSELILSAAALTMVGQRSDLQGIPRVAIAKKQ